MSAALSLGHENSEANPVASSLDTSPTQTRAGRTELVAAKRDAWRG